MSDRTIDRCSIGLCMIVDKPDTAVRIGSQVPDVDDLVAARALAARNRIIRYVPRRSEEADRVWDRRLLCEPDVSVRSGGDETRMNLHVESRLGHSVTGNISAHVMAGK